ncbi:MAG: hypothetical protein V3V47_07945 [Desulfobacteria bacterium]
MGKPHIVLEEKYDSLGRYLGKIVVYESDLTPELLEYIKNDKDWKKYHKKLKDRGYDVE